MGQLNWLGVVLAFVANELIGGTWYGYLFKDRWMALAKPNTDMNSNMPMVYGAIVGLIAVLGLAWLIRKLGEETLMGGLKIGLIAGIAFAATSVLLDPIYGGRAAELMMIEGGYVVVFYAIAGAIIGGVKLPAKKAVAA